jgi:hypothetical protein
MVSAEAVGIATAVVIRKDSKGEEDGLAFAGLSLLISGVQDLIAERLPHQCPDKCQEDNDAPLEPPPSLL